MTGQGSKLSDYTGSSGDSAEKNECCHDQVKQAPSPNFAQDTDIFEALAITTTESMIDRPGSASDG